MAALCEMKLNLQLAKYQQAAQALVQAPQALVQAPGQALQARAQLHPPFP